MISYDRYLAVLAKSDAKVRQAADAAFQALLAKIRAGETALEAVLKAFNADVMDGFREALNAVLQAALGPRPEIKAYQVARSSCLTPCMPTPRPCPLSRGRSSTSTCKQPLLCQPHCPDRVALQLHRPAGAGAAGGRPD